MLQAVADEGYTTPTPIQARAIPEILTGRDVLAAAQTGTGKTAAFTLPLLQRLAAKPAHDHRRIRALVLVPTRELAAQVDQSFRTYGRHLPQLRTALIFGGVNINPQIGLLKRGVDVVIATPGRLLDHAGQNTVNLSAVEILVLDEADRMLDMGFIRDIRRILKLLPAARQNLLLSATFSDDIRGLAHGLLRDPVTIEVAPRNTTVEAISQSMMFVDKTQKPYVLSQLIRDGQWRQTLVFTRTKRGANKLAERLAHDGIATAALHGNKSQGARTRALAEFKAGQVRVLVATDIAARGLDIDQLPHVVNFELPNVPEDYVHRIGRTGRAGLSGEALSLVGHDERDELRAIERLLKRSIPQLQFEGAASAPRLHESAPAQHRAPSHPQPAHRHAGGHRRGQGHNGHKGHGGHHGHAGRNGHGHAGRSPGAAGQVHGHAQGHAAPGHSSAASHQSAGHGQAAPAAPGASGRRWSGRRARRPFAATTR